jgi:hypothetical protein
LPLNIFKNNKGENKTIVKSMKTDWNETFKFEEQENDLEQLTTANSDINGSIESLSGEFIQ